MTKIILSALLSFCYASTALAQLSSSVYLRPLAVSDVTVPFSSSDEGTSLPMLWGLDTSWNNVQNMRKGINHTGKDNLAIARCSFQAIAALTGDTALTAAMINNLKSRLSTIAYLSDSCDLLLNNDQDAYGGTAGGLPEYYLSDGKYDNGHWADMIIAYVKWIHANTKHKVVAIAPYNEPDYGWGEGGKSDFLAICKALSENDATKDIAIAAGNTLNCDYASAWYNYIKPYVTWGTTHQLAGSFDTFASFFTEVSDDGNHGMADEMHNVNEAMIAANYGGEAGIWWSFDAQSRGLFQQMSNHGVRLAYGEDPDDWTAAAVYRYDDTLSTTSFTRQGDIAAFLGSSERQAYTSSFLFVSKDRDMFFDGDGPRRDYLMVMPGGTAYQTGQSNAERVIQIYSGADAPPGVITAGNYKIVNAYSQNVLSEQGTGSGTNINVKPDKRKTTQQWTVTPVSSTNGGDYSYFTIACVAEPANYADVDNWGLDDGDNVMAYAGTAGGNEQWMFKYAGNGYYRVLNRESNLYLQTTASKGYANVQQGAYKDHQRQLWRLLPVDVTIDTVAPAEITGLSAEAREAAVELSWTAGNEDDLEGYNIIRCDAGSENSGYNDPGAWNTIARKVNVTKFIDNTVIPKKSYIYKVIAVDSCYNLSKASTAVECRAYGNSGLTARWTFDGDLTDESVNAFDAAIYGTARWVSAASFHKEGTQSLLLNGSSYVQLPYLVASTEALTFTAWVYWSGGNDAWQRIFDFGNGTSQYMFLTPNNGNVMRLAIKNDGDEQQVDAESKLPLAKWTHIAVTISGEGAKIYVNGELTGQNSAVTIMPKDISPVMNYLGRSQFADDPLYKGYLDDVRIYNFELSADEIAAVLNGAADNISPPVSVKPEKYFNIRGQYVSDGCRGLLIDTNGKKSLRE